MIVRRQLELLSHLLDKEKPVEWQHLVAEASHLYTKHKDRPAAIARDIGRLRALGAVKIEWALTRQRPLISVNLDWPSTITETEFFDLIKKLPKSKDYSFLTKP